MSMPEAQSHVPPIDGRYDKAAYGLLLEFEQTGIGHVPFKAMTRPGEAAEHADIDAIYSWWAQRGYTIEGFTAWLDGAERKWHLIPVLKPEGDGPVGWTREPEWDGVA